MESVQDMAARLLHRMVESGDIPVDVVGGREAHMRRKKTGQLVMQVDGQRPVDTASWANPWMQESALDVLADWA